VRRALLVAAVLCLATAARAREVPFLSSRVTDEARLLDAGSAAALEATLKAYEDRTGRQIAVLTIPSLEGEALEDYSLKVARTWKLGRKGKDDGVLILVARDDRKIRIEVGYGLEGELTDAQAGRIIRDDMVPRFRRGDYAKGLREGVDAVIASLDPASPSRPGPGAKELLKLTAVVLILLWFVASASYQFIFLAAYGCALEFLMADVLVTVGLMDLFGVDAGTAFIGYPAVLILLRLYASTTAWGRGLAKNSKRKGTTEHWIAGVLGSDGSSSGGFSGGGGGFGGGGASGSW
jgi:uncharacterized protein